MGALAVVLVGCGGGGDRSLPECAAALPLPADLSVVEVTAEPSDSNPTCAVTLSSADPIDEVVTAWRAALDEAGVAHEAQHQPGVQAVLRLDGPVCGSLLVFAAGTERVTESVPGDRTPALASIVECRE